MKKNKFIPDPDCCFGHPTGMFTVKSRRRKAWQQSIYPDTSSG